MTPTAVVDVRMHGKARLAAAYLVRGEEGVALVDCGPASSLEAVARALEEAGVERLDWIVLTHVHLDHAGAAGGLAAMHPEAKVLVSAGAARHVLDPSRLWAGVQHVYGGEAERLWGKPIGLAPERVVAAEDGDTVELGGARLRALATPGHTRHHLAWIEQESGDAFVGDAVGMRAGELWRATTPPVDFDFDLAVASIGRLRECRPRRLLLGHFGVAVDGPPDAEAAAAGLDRGLAALHDWRGAVEEASLKAGVEGVEEAASAGRDRRERGADPGQRQLLDATSPIAIDVGGMLGWLRRERG